MEPDTNLFPCPRSMIDLFTTRVYTCQSISNCAIIYDKRCCSTGTVFDLSRESLLSDLGEQTERRESALSFLQGYCVIAD